MKIFLLKITLFSVLVLLIIGGLHILLPYYWGNSGIATKFEEIKKIEVNHYFFGSSRTFRQINPTLFDSLSSTDSKSYNLGYAATYIPETFVLLEHFLKKSDFKKETTIFFELQDLNQISDNNFHSVNTKYYLRLKDVKFISNYLDETSLDEELKQDILAKYRKSYIEKTFMLGCLEDLLKSLLKKDLNKNIIKKSSNGYLSLDKELSFKNTSKSLQNRRSDFLSDTISLSNRSQSIDSIFNSGINNKLNLTYIKKLTELQELAKSKNVKLYYTIYPRMEATAYELLVPLVQKLKKDYIINLANPKDYPEFYTTENSFDVGHLNEKGASLLTQKLVLEYNKVVKKN
jgi:hypothetical protein